jgi:hypothetical protein
MTGFSFKLPSPTTSTPAYLCVRYSIYLLSYILNTYASAIHTLIDLKSIRHIYRIKPQKLSLASAAIAFELGHCRFHLGQSTQLLPLALLQRLHDATKFDGKSNPP